VQALGPRAVNGVVACSSGNHAQGVSEAARLAGIRSVIVMPADAPVLKRERTGRSGARVVLYDREREDRDAIALAIAREEGLAFIHPYNDPDVIAGQGTAGLEIAADCAALGIAPDTLVVPCSGGGLAAGTTLAIKDRFPDAGVYVAEPRDFDDYARSLGAGSRQSNTLRGGSLCDALLAEMPGAIGWHINSKARRRGPRATGGALYAVGFASTSEAGDRTRAARSACSAPVGEGSKRPGAQSWLCCPGGNVADDVLRKRSGLIAPGAGPWAAN
jgi:threonine dehydratase